MAYQQCEPSPPPHAVNLRQSGFPHPEELGFDRGESVLRVVIGTAYEVQELAMQFGSG
jgi:hypothetical protein